MGTCGGNQQPLTRDVLGHTVAVLKKHGGNMACSARELGISRPTLRHRLERARAMGLEVPAARPRPRKKPGDSVSLEQDEKECRLITLSPRIQTAEQAMAKAEIDLDVWEPYRQIVNSWEQGSKVPGVGVAITPLWQVKVFLRRRVTDPLEAALAALVERLERAAPRSAQAGHRARARRAHAGDRPVRPPFRQTGLEPGDGPGLRPAHCRGPVRQGRAISAGQGLAVPAARDRAAHRPGLLPRGQPGQHPPSAARPRTWTRVCPRCWRPGFMAVVKAVHQARLHARPRA